MPAKTCKVDDMQFLLSVIASMGSINVRLCLLFVLCKPVLTVT
jgi:hypothetical protein